jgi:diphthamide biosynthesis protein 2
MDVDTCAGRISSFVEKGGFKRVALEMDSEHLSFVVPLLAILNRPRVYFVQGERWHGGCCLETVGDQHVDADAIVHFGDWCFCAAPAGVGLLIEPGQHMLPHLPGETVLFCTPTFVFFFLFFFQDAPPAGARLLYHLSLSHHVDALAEYARVHGLEFEAVPLSYLPGAVFPNNMFASSVPVVYISPLPDDPRAFLLSLACPEVVHAAPSRAPSALFYGRRMKAVNKCRDTRATGLLAVSPGATGAAAELKRLAAQVRAAGRVPYTLCVGKAGPIKLLNLPGLSVFVLVGCPLSTLLLSETLASPVCTILTPLEHEMACKPEKAWKPLFLFGDVENVDLTDEDDDCDGNESHVEEKKEASSSALVFVGDTARAVAKVSPAAALLRQPGRWMGLDPDSAHLTAVPAIEGRSGVASGYEQEPQNKN